MGKLLIEKTSLISSSLFTSFNLYHYPVLDNQLRGHTARSKVFEGKAKSRAEPAVITRIRDSVPFAIPFFLSLVFRTFEAVFLLSL